jgi:hypothetical protein
VAEFTEELSVARTGETVKLNLCLVALAIVLLNSPHYAGATTVFETTGWIVEEKEENRGLTKRISSAIAAMALGWVQRHRG